MRYAILMVVDPYSSTVCTTKMSSTTSATPPTTPSTTVSNETYLIKVTLYNTSDPIVNRLLSVPGEIQFGEFHEAIAAAFGWDSERCTSWSFQNTKKSPLVACPTPGDFAIYYTLPYQGYDVSPFSLYDKDRLNEWMGLEPLRKFWLYDYNISKYHHAIEVMEIVDNDGLSKIRCLGGQGSIKRKSWQFGNFSSQKGILAGLSSWEFDMASTHIKMESVQAKYEKRTGKEAVVHMDATPVEEDESSVKREDVTPVKEDATPVKEGMDDDDDDVVVRPNRGTKRKLSGSF